MGFVSQVALAFTGVTLLGACSGPGAPDSGAVDGTESSLVEPPAQYDGPASGSVEQALSFTSLPACRFFNEGVVYYVNSPAAKVGYYYCRSGSWQLIPAVAGSTGAQGSRGATGIRGPTGAQGPAGAQGPTGTTGVRGAPGITGPAGSGGSSRPQLVHVAVSDSCQQVDIGIDDNGNGQLEPAEVDSSGQTCDGPTGATGGRGATGANGATGPRGLTGADGATGERGITGATGQIGPTGAQGPTGALGAAGLTGASGATGVRGPTGPTGATGATGARGAAGPAGNTGPTGPRGPTGGVTPPVPVCGNGVVERGEQCDLGPVNGNSGCTVQCTFLTPTNCLACAQQLCAQQYDNALGSKSDADNLAKVSQVLDCVIGPDFELDGRIPPSSCFFADPAQPGGSFVPCYCGSTPQATCLTTGPVNSSEACGAQMETASGCNPATATCVTTNGSNPATALGDVVQLVNCERVACGAACGFPPDEDSPPPLCGNGVQEAGEQCDLGAANGGPDCTAQCRLTAVCGNGVLEFGEQCDLGAANGGPDCTAQCRLPVTCSNDECGGEPFGSCIACAEARCAAQYANALGTASDAAHVASVSELLACVIGPDFAGGAPIPQSSCFFADPFQPRGSLVPCYCGGTPQATCLATGPLDPSEACGAEIEQASLCNPISASCVVSSGSSATPLGDVIRLLNCERAACATDCGIPEGFPE